jgi:RNA polymerase sigma factor (TIGR02999 family)
MGDVRDGDVDELLARLRQGDEQASAELFTRLYGELRALAGAVFRGQKDGHTLQPTAVLHEAWVKMVRAGGGNVQDRGHFFAIAARAMRQVLVNHARDRNAEKRGAGNVVTLVTLAGLGGEGAAGHDADVLDVHAALEELARLDARQAQIAELRFFAGLTTAETAQSLGVAPRTVELDWTMAKRWLAQRLRGASDEG